MFTLLLILWTFFCVLKCSKTFDNSNERNWASAKLKWRWTHRGAKFTVLERTGMGWTRNKKSTVRRIIKCRRTFSVNKMTKMTFLFLKMAKQYSILVFNHFLITSLTPRSEQKFLQSRLSQNIYIQSSMWLK